MEEAGSIKPLGRAVHGRGESRTASQRSSERLPLALSAMGGDAPAADGLSKEVKTEPVAPATLPVPAHLRDELFLKFAGTATIIIGLVLLLASTIAMGVLSVLKFDIAPWIPILPLSLLVILVGGLITVYFRKVVERSINPPKPEAARPPYGFVYPYQMPQSAYPPRMPAPSMYPSAPAPGAYPSMPGAAWGPQAGTAAPRPSSRFCIMCGRRIPVEAKFCPYCRHAYPA